MEIKILQEKVDNWIKKHGIRYFNELTNMAILTEEVGEVARIIARKYGEQSNKESDKNIDLGEELSDVLFVVLCLANSTKTDLQKAFDNKMRLKAIRDEKRHFDNKKLSMILQKKTLIPNNILKVNTSKSISNRYLVMQKLYPDSFSIHSVSNAEDTILLQKALISQENTIDVHHAGTSIRFLLAYLAFRTKEKIKLTGSERLQQRPIKKLVDALCNLGAKIEYEKQEGFPPLIIHPSKILKKQISISADTSSQFISALMLVAPSFEEGLKINLEGKITSKPYIIMTQRVMQSMGIDVKFENNLIEIEHKVEIEKNQCFEIEGDWSAASYFYSMVAFAKEKLVLKNFYSNSLQGDADIKRIFELYFGVKSEFIKFELHLIPIENFEYPKQIIIDLNHCPDIAQSLCVIASMLKIPFYFSGLETLKIKETDRLVAMQNELKKIGTETEISDSTIKSICFNEITENPKIATYKDHRMAMSFAVFALKSNLEIEQAGVVEKSYPDFWKDFESITKEI